MRIFYLLNDILLKKDKQLTTYTTQLIMHIKSF